MKFMTFCRLSHNIKIRQKQSEKILSNVRNRVCFQTNINHLLSCITNKKKDKILIHQILFWETNVIHEEEIHKKFDGL